MRKWNKKTKIAVFIIFLILAVLFAALCWKKRRGIYNTYMKLTGQEIPYSVQEKRRKKYGYYDQKLNASMNLENPVTIAALHNIAITFFQFFIFLPHFYHIL